MDKREILERVYGYTQFRPGQEGLIDGVLSGRDVFGIMPTGGGKSICYQLPALMLPGITLVVSPLISLMHDQVMALKAAGIPAAYLNSSLTFPQSQAVWRNLRAGKYKLVYVAPERLDNEGVLDLCRSLPIGFLAVDEAHCISQWGQDFRPSYLRILTFLNALPRRPVVGAYTATATVQVREDVENILKLRDPVVAVTGFDRPNLSFEVRKPDRKGDELRRILARQHGKSGIIYCATRKKVESVCQTLRDQGYAAARYHAGLPESERTQNQEDFLYDRTPIMVATNAFGMGIDKSNVGFVIHYNMPMCLENYYQEAGRAGRDGTDAQCILLYSKGDVGTAEFLINSPSENDELSQAEREQLRQRDLKRLDAMVRYCNTGECLRGYLLSYFGQSHPELCGNCGNCRGSCEEVEITREAQMILSCVRRMKDTLGSWPSLKNLARTLRGSRDREILELGLQNLSTYGLMADRSRTEVTSMIEHLEGEGYLRREGEGLVLAETAGEVLFRGKPVKQLIRTEKQEEQEDSLSPTEADLFDALKALRARLAGKAGIAPYMVFSNATLKDMAQKQPTTMLAFKRVSGVGELKAKWYAKDFLRCIQTFRGEL